MPAFNKPVRINCKAGSVSVRLVLETARYKDDGIPYGIDSPFCCANATITVRQSRSVEDRGIGKQFAPLWRELSDQLKILFPDGDDEGAFIVPALDTRSHVLSNKDRRNGIGKLVFKRSSLEADKLLLWSHLICPFLVFLLMCCNGFSLKPTRPKCDGRLFASSPFCRRVEAPFSCGFPLRWVLYIVLSLTRRVNVHDATPPCSREGSLYECGRPCDALSCLFFSAVWLQSNQSILVQETRSAKDIDLTRFNTFPIKAATCLQVGPTSLDWPVDPFARFDHSRSSLSPEFPSDGQQRGALPASSRSRWRQNTLQAPPQVLQRITGWDGCGPFLSGGLCGVFLGTPGVSLDRVFSKQKNREFKLKYLKKLFATRNILCLQEVHGKDEHLQAIQVLAARFSFFVPFSLKTKTRRIGYLHSQGHSVVKYSFMCTLPMMVSRLMILMSTCVLTFRSFHEISTVGCGWRLRWMRRLSHVDRRTSCF